MKHRRSLILAFVWLAATQASVWGASAWPEYRGPLQDGHAPDAAPPLQWSETENIRWKTPIHDRGWSTPVVLDGKLWMTTAREDGTQMFVVCVDLDDGHIVFDQKLLDVPNPEPLGNAMNGYASPSAVVEPGRVYVHFGTYGTFCLDAATCRVIWQRLDLPCRHYRGPGSSPILFEQFLVFHMDGADQQYVIALDKSTGNTVWRTDRSTDYNDLDEQGRPTQEGDLRKAFNTPLVIHVGNRPLLISPAAKAAYAYDPSTGREIWQVRHRGQASACRTLFDGQFVFINTGSSVTELLAVRPDGQGEITASHVGWTQNRYVPQRSSPVLVDRCIFSCNTSGVASCVDSRDGKLIWEERLNGAFTASILHAGGHLYYCSEQGDTYVVRPGRDYQQVAVNTLGDGFMASPIAVDRALYLRSRTHLYRVEAPVTP